MAASIIKQCNSWPYQNRQMKYSRVIASSISVHVEDEDYQARQLDNPTCAETISCLPKIYGKKHHSRFMEKANRYDTSEELGDSRVVSRKRNRDTAVSHLAKNSPYYNQDRLSRSKLTIDTDAMETLRSSKYLLPKGLPRILEEGKTKYQNLKSRKIYSIDALRSHKKKSTHQNNKKVRNSSVVSAERTSKVIFNEKKLKKWSSLGSHSDEKQQSQKETFVTDSEKPTYFAFLSKLSLSPKNVQSKSRQSVSIFKIPTKKELPQVIQKYVPLDCAFDIRQLVSTSKQFQIIHCPQGVYIGEVQNQKPHGIGILFTSKRIFEGIFKNGHKIKGTEKCSEGIYKGLFREGKRHGNGEFSWANGQAYKGMWINGQKHGEGRWADSFGNYYEGEWIENRQEGEGVFFYKGKNPRGKGSLYKGAFKNFLKHGFGEQSLPNGDHYIGEYAFGRPHGQGKYTWREGRTYIGTFLNGLKLGEQKQAGTEDSPNNN